MTPKDHFDVAMERAEHLLRLYDLLHDTRARKVRADWATKFVPLMHWPKVEKIVRVDGKGQNSILILREIAQRRNQIVHEADIVRKAKTKTITMRDISIKTASAWADWMRSFVAATDSVVASTV